jgi:hypothetical protein
LKLGELKVLIKVSIGYNRQEMYYSNPNVEKKEQEVVKTFQSIMGSLGTCNEAISARL